ncbi:MAG: homoserine dehydrogenase [Chloroflexi bacterium]|nr:homoserine dehydrogenase [Chloroflexota bacterium]
MRIAIIGFGVVGQGLAEILRDRAAELQSAHNFHGEIVAVATRSRGTLYHPDGLDTAQLLEAIGKGHLGHYPHVYGLTRNWDALTLVRQSNADVVVEVSPTDLQTGQPALDVCYAALDSGKHLVLANKGPLVVAYEALHERARLAGLRLCFEGTVMAGTPVLRLAQQDLAGCRISEARGILNGTTNYILTQMGTGLSYAEALQQAQRLGYAEANPAADVEGWDAAAKLVILSGVLFGTPLALHDLDVRGITGITPQDMEAARQAGERWKLIARVTPEGGSVRPMRLPLSDPLAAVSGATNAITYVTDLLGSVTLVGAGAGRLSTGFAVLSDLLDIHRTS